MATFCKDRALQGEKGSPEVEADLLDKTEVYLTSALAVEVLTRKKMKAYLQKGQGAGPGVMEETAATADNLFVVLKILCRDNFYYDFRFITRLYIVNCFKKHF